ncbi:hypothetical protein P9112_009545 [Eukaryota sp. TZLM1-RC]
MACCGGVSSSSPVDPEVNQLVQSLRPQIESKLGSSFPQFDPIEMQTQVVAGMNYFVRINVGYPDKVVDARIFHQAWSNTTEVSSARMVPPSQPLGYFE